MEVEQQHHHKSKNTPFGVVPTPEEKAAALELIKRYTDNRENHKDEEEEDDDDDESKVISAMNMVAAASAAAYGEDAEALAAAQDVLKCEWATSAQIVRPAFYIYSISSFYANDSPVEVTRAARVKLSDVRDMKALGVVLTSYWKTRSNKLKSAANILDFNCAASEFTSFEITYDFESFLNEYYAEAKDPSAETLNVLARLIRVCSLVQCSKGKTKLSEKTLEEVKKIVADPCSFDNSALVGAALALAVRRGFSDAVSTDGVVAFCRAQLAKGCSRLARCFFEDAFEVALNWKDAAIKKDTKKQQYIEDITRLFISALPSMILYEDTSEVFSHVRKTFAVLVDARRNMSFYADSLLKLVASGKPFVEVADDDASDKQKEDAALAKLMAIATLMNQLFPSRQAVRIVAGRKGLACTITSAFYNGLRCLKTRENIVKVLNAFSTAFQLDALLHPAMRNEIVKSFTEAVAKEFPEGLTLKTFDGLGSAEMAALVENKQSALDSLAMTFCTFVASDGCSNDSLVLSNAQGLCWLSFFTDSMTQTLFRRKVLCSNGVSTSFVDDILAAGIERMALFMEDPGWMAFGRRFFEAINSLSKSAIESFFSKHSASMEGIIALARAIVELYPVPDEHAAAADKDDDDDNDNVIELEENNNENSEERDALLVRVFNLIFSLNILRGNFSEYTMEIIEAKPTLLFVLPKPVCNNILALAGKVAQDDLAARKRRRAAEAAGAGERDGGNGGGDGEQQQIKDFKVSESTFVELSMMGIGKHQVQVTANYIKKDSPNDIANAYFENMAKIDSEAAIRQSAEDAENLKRAQEEEEEEEEAKAAAEAAKGDDDDDGKEEREEVFSFPNYVSGSFVLGKVYTTLSKAYPKNKDAIWEFSVGEPMRYVRQSKEDLFTVMRYVTKKFDPELVLPFTAELAVGIAVHFASKVDEFGLTEDDTRLITATIEKLVESFTSKLRVSDDGDKFSPEGFALQLKSYANIALIPLSNANSTNAEALLTSFRDDIYSVTLMQRVLPDNSIAETCVLTLSALAKHWPAFVAVEDKSVLESVLRNLGDCVWAVRNTPVITQSDLTPLFTIIGDSESNAKMSPECVMQLCRVAKGFASQTADDVIIMIYRICEGFAQFGDNNTDVFAACFDSMSSTEDVRAFIIAGSVALSIPQKSDSGSAALYLKEGKDQADFLSSVVVTDIVQAGAQRRAAIIDALEKLCAGKNSTVAKAVAGYLWMALPSMSMQKPGSRQWQLAAELGTQEYALPFIGGNESLVLKNNAGDFFNGLSVGMMMMMGTDKASALYVEKLSWFIMQKIIGKIRHKGQRAAFVQAFLKSSSAPVILDTLIKSTSSFAWVFIRVILSMCYKGSESVLKYIDSAAESATAASRSRSRSPRPSRGEKKPAGLMSEEEQIEMAVRLSMAQDLMEQNDLQHDNLLAWKWCQNELMSRFDGIKDGNSLGLLEISKNAVVDRFDTEDLDATCDDVAPVLMDMQNYNRETINVPTDYMKKSVTLLYASIANNAFSCEPANTDEEAAADTKLLKEQEKAARMAAYKEEKQTTMATYASFIENLPPNMQGEIRQGLEDALRQLRVKYKISGEGEDEGSGDEGVRNKISVDTLYAKAMRLHENVKNRCYANNTSDAFQASQSPVETNNVVFTPNQIAAGIATLAKNLGVSEEGSTPAADNWNVLMRNIMSWALLLALCKPTREVLYDGVIALFCACVHKRPSAAFFIVDDFLDSVLSESRRSAYGPDVILLSSARVKALVEGLAVLLTKVHNSKEPKPERLVYSMISRIVQDLVPQSQLTEALAPSGKNGVMCMEISKEALEAIINCEVAGIRDIEDVTTKLAGNKVNRAVLYGAMWDKLKCLVKNETTELQNVAKLISTKVINRTNEGLNLFKDSKALETYLKLFCRITTATMRGEKLNKNRAAQYLGDYVIHCDFEDLGLDDLCTEVEGVLRAIETVCPAFRPDGGGDYDDDEIVVEAPPTKIPPETRRRQLYTKIRDDIQRLSDLINAQRLQQQQGNNGYVPPFIGLQPQQPQPQQQQPPPPPQQQQQYPPQQPQVAQPIEQIPQYIQMQQQQQSQPLQSFFAPPQVPQQVQHPNLIFGGQQQQQHLFGMPQPYIPQAAPQQAATMFTTRPQFQPHMQFYGQRLQRHSNSRIDFILDQLQASRDPNEIETLIDMLVHSYRHPPIQSTGLAALTDFFDLAEEFSTVVKALLSCVDRSEELIVLVDPNTFDSMNRAMKCALNNASQGVSNEVQEVVRQCTDLINVLSESINEAMNSLLGDPRLREIAEQRLREWGFNRRGITVDKAPFTNVVVALASLLDVVYITLMSKERSEYEKHHSNEAEESTLLHMSGSTGAGLSGDTGPTFFKVHEKLLSAVIRGDLGLISGPLKSLAVNVPSLVSFEDKER